MSATANTEKLTPPTLPAQPATYSLSGAVTGLLAGGDTFVVLDAGAAGSVHVENDGAFTFPDEVETGTTYNVAVTQGERPAPKMLLCEVSAGEGTVNDADVTDISTFIRMAAASRARRNSVFTSRAAWPFFVARRGVS